MKSAALQGQSSLRSAWRATECVSPDLTLFPQSSAFQRPESGLTPSLRTMSEHPLAP